MKHIEYTTIDKTDWLRGPWDNEPDKVQWQDEATELPCLIVRSRNSGALCGYVGVAESHEFYGKGYDEAKRADGEYIDVHGGLTFADKCQPSTDESRGICHIPGTGEPDHVWWFGFDCNHAWDIGPSLRKRDIESGWAAMDEIYRDIDYVRTEVRKLAAQLVRS